MATEIAILPSSIFNVDSALTFGPRSTTEAEEDEETRIILRGSQKSKSELLSILPHQSFSESDGVLNLILADSTNEVQVSVKLVVDAAPGCGGIAWPSGQVLSSYLAQTYRTTTPLAGKSVLELGSGTGLVGLIVGKLDASCRVYITDQAPLLDIMARNVALNSLEDNVSVAELNWGEPIPSNLPPKPDIILAADCVYFEPAFPLLVQTLADLSDSSTQILFCYKKRRKADKRFFSLLKKRFTWDQVDDPSRVVYDQEAITLLELHKIAERTQARGKKK